MDGARYQKEGDASSKGSRFQVDILTMFLLNALQRLKDWRLSTENKRAGKFDDVVLEWPEGVVLLQAKHKKKKRKKITMEELLSTNTRNDDFSLPKYFLSYQKMKHEFKGSKTLIICSNADFHQNVLELLDSRKISSESMLYCPSDDYLFYTLNTKILSHLKQGVEEYLEKNNRNKDIDQSVITYEHLNDFLDHLQIFAKFPSDNSLEIVIEQLLSAMKRCNGLYENIFSLELRSKVTNWFQHKEGLYLTELRAKAIFSELRTEKYWQTLEQHGVEFQRNDLQFPESKRIYHVVAQNGYLLEVIKIYHALRHCKTKILSINQDDNIEVQRQVVEAFQLTQYSHLIIVWPKSTGESVITAITDELNATLTTHEHKKIILVTESDDKLNRLFGLNESDINISFGSSTFNDLSDETQKKLLNKRNIVFQGRDISLKELFLTRDSNDLEKAADLSLRRLTGDEKVIVGAPLLDLNQNITHLYINRTFKDEEIKVLYSEENIYDVPGKIIVISDTAGTGKTTVLTNLAAVIKEKYPLLWVIRIELNDFSAVLRDFLKNKRKSVNVLDLLQSKHTTRLTNELDNFIFAMEKEVVLMLDGVDEVSPDYTDLVIDLLLQCQEATNFVKVIVTTRPHVVSKLQETLKVASFTLEPFTEENQIYFLTRCWTSYLNLREDVDKRKCEKYARALVNKMSLIDLNNRVEDHFAAIPLQLRMLAEIFQNSMVSDESPDWEGCQEYLHANEEDPRLPEKMNLLKLYDMFVDKKRDIFMDKENPDGHTAATRALSDQFDECFHFHRDVALNIVLREEECHLFPHYGNNERMEAVALKIGIVKKLDCEFNFIHRTLAEYFVAQSIIRELRCQNQNPEFEKFLIEEVFYKDAYSTVLAFFDNLLQDSLDSIPSTTFQNYQTLSYSLQFMSYYIYIIHELAEKGCVAVLHLLLKCINFTIIRNEEGSIHELYIDSNIGNHNTLTHLESILKQVGLNLKDDSGRTPLHCAAGKGHLKMVKFLVEHGANINSIGEYHSPLVEAAQNGHADVTKYLLEQALVLETTRVDETFKVNDSDIAAFLFEIVLGNSGLHIENTMVPYMAACMGCFKVLETSIERGINVDSKYENGETLIFGAARGRQLLTIEYLVKKGANIDNRDDRGRTALHLIAGEHNAKPAAELLIRLGVDINITDNVGNTALHIAASNNNLEMTDLLLKSGANVNLRDQSGRTALHIAAFCSNPDCVKALTNNGADVNIRDEEDNSALQLCIDIWLQSMSVKCLSENSADINIKNHHGLTDFLGFIRKKCEDIIKFFVEVGMNVNTTDKRGYTPLYLAVEEILNDTGVNSTYEEWENGNEWSSLKFLLDQGANVNIMAKNGRTVLHLAVEKRHLHAIRLFIEAGAEVSATDSLGYTALHLAAADNLSYDVNSTYEEFKTKSECSSLRVLLDLGVNANIVDTYGCTILHLAVEAEHLHAIKFFIEAGADVNAKDKTGRTPLHTAVVGCAEEVVKFLIEQCADTTGRDNMGYTPYVLAKETGKFHLLEYLKKKDTK